MAYAADLLKDTLDCRLIVEKALGPPESRSGGIWTFPCPFHAEHTVGGFKVYRDGFKCFSCGEYGSVIDWQMKRHGQTFPEAVEALGGGKPVTDDDRRRYEQERYERIERELKEAQEKIDNARRELRELKSWQQYHDNMTMRGHYLWDQRGLSDSWQSYWQLGWTQAGQVFSSETLSIPIWGYDWEINNVKHRLIGVEAGGKYIQEKKGVPAAPFICDPTETKGPLLLVEGEIKAMVTFATWDNTGLQIAGLPGATPSVEITNLFENFDPIYLLMDPDAYEANGKASPVDRVIDMLGKERTRLMYLPMKVDDAILSGALSKDGIKRMIKAAR